MRARSAGVLFGILTLLVVVWPALAAPTLQAVRLWPAPDYSRIALELSDAPAYKYFSLANPHRLVIDLRELDAATLNAKLGELAQTQDPLIASLRAGINQPGVTRLVVELKREVRAQVFTLKPLGDYGHRLVVDLYPGAEVAATSVARAAPTSVTPPAMATQVEQAITRASREPPGKAGRAEADKPAQESKPALAKVEAVKEVAKPVLAKAAVQAPEAANPEYLRLITVAIDPGHGGEDPGALGANGSREKDITLAVARRLKAHIDRQENMRAVLTRDGDYFIPLHDRVNKARRAQADLFVSIHADAFMKSTARGSSVFALSEKGATSAAARWLAKRENDADLVGGINIDVKNIYLKQTLIDLSQTATIADSLKLGRAVLDELAEINDLHRGHVEQAGFAVLKAPDIPSILVETAFISNPDEEKRLLDEAYQEQMAEAIVSGIRRYFDKNPPLARNKVAQRF